MPHKQGQSDPVFLFQANGLIVGLFYSNKMAALPAIFYLPVALRLIRSAQIPFMLQFEQNLLHGFVHTQVGCINR